MIDLISRSALIEKLKKALPYTNGITKLTTKIIIREIENQPTIEAKPVVHGEWVGNACSACGMNWDENMVNNADDWGYFEPMPNFCPNCGSDMRKEHE